MAINLKLSAVYYRVTGQRVCKFGEYQHGSAIGPFNTPLTLEQRHNLLTLDAL